MIAEIDSIVKGSLTDLVERVFDSSRFGRDREVVSLYAFGHLMQYCDPDGFLRHPTQIMIESAVPQIDGPNRKKLVCKDLVIWPEPGMNCWNEAREPVHFPAAIMEWKVNMTVVSSDDTTWLCEFSGSLSDFVGYAVCLDLDARRFRLSCTRVCRGRPHREWLLL